MDVVWKELGGAFQSMCQVADREAGDGLGEGEGEAYSIPHAAGQCTVFVFFVALLNC